MTRARITVALTAFRKQPKLKIKTQKKRLDGRLIFVAKSMVPRKQSGTVRLSLNFRHKKISTM